jgi:DNA-binding NarL/FixJ family response regulator
MKRLWLITDNLMTRSWLEPPCRAAGAELVREGAEEPDLIAVDLAAQRSLERLAELRAAHPRARILAFGPHVDASTFEGARRAGADEVVARGKALDRLLARLLGMA